MFSKDKIKDNICILHNGICKTHTFELKPISRVSDVIPHTLQLYCPNGAGLSGEPDTAYPIFNLDNKYYTPAFITQKCERFYQKNDSFLKLQFEKLVQQKLLYSRNQALNQPMKTNQTCHVCNLNYQDYLEHINQISHKKYVRASIANKYIQTLCLPYKLEAKLKKKTKISDEINTNRSSRASVRLRLAEQKKNKKDQIMNQFSTMTTQKEVKNTDSVTRKMIRKTTGSGVIKK